MNKKLEVYMKENLGVSYADLESMDDDELDKLYERACDLEEVVAVEADGEITEAGELAAHLVDFLYEYPPEE